MWNRFFRCVFSVKAVIFLLLSGTARPDEAIVVAYSGVSGFQGPLWAFSELKLFPKYNLNPEIVLIAGGTQSMQALLSGYTHFALASATPPLSVGLRGGNVVFMAGYSEAIYRLMQSKDTGVRIYKKYLNQPDSKIPEATYDDIAGKSSFPPRVNRQGLRNANELVSKNGTGDVALSQLVDETVIDELQREDFFESLKKK